MKKVSFRSITRTFSDDVVLMLDDNPQITFGVIQRTDKLIISNEPFNSTRISTAFPVTFPRVKTIRWFYMVNTSSPNRRVVSTIKEDDKEEQWEYNIFGDWKTVDFKVEHVPFTLVINNTASGFVLHKDFIENRQTVILYPFWLKVDYRTKTVFPRILEVYHESQMAFTVIRDFYYIELTNDTHRLLFRHRRHFSSNLLLNYINRTLFLDNPPTGFIFQDVVTFVESKVKHCVYQMSFKSLYALNDSLPNSILVNYKGIPFENYFVCDYNLGRLNDKTPRENRCQEKLPNNMQFINPFDVEEEQFTHHNQYENTETFFYSEQVETRFTYLYILTSVFLLLVFIFLLVCFLFRKKLKPQFSNKNKTRFLRKGAYSPVLVDKQRQVFNPANSVTYSSSSSASFYQ